ncbi:MAG: response regulator [Patescibacteria group bacterium]
MSGVVKKILIVEDDTFISSLVKARLEKEGFEVVQAFDGEEGLRLLKAEKPDLIILDLIMPKSSGFELMEQLNINVEFNQIPLMILSNLAQESDIQKAKNLGAREFFIKIRTSIDDVVARAKELMG